MFVWFTEDVFRSYDEITANTMLLSMVHLTIYILALLIPDVDLNLTLIEYAMVSQKRVFVSNALTTST